MSKTLTTSLSITTLLTAPTPEALEAEFQAALRRTEVLYAAGPRARGLTVSGAQGNVTRPPGLISVLLITMTATVTHAEYVGTLSYLPEYADLGRKVLLELLTPWLPTAKVLYSAGVVQEAGREPRMLLRPSESLLLGPVAPTLAPCDDD